MNYPPLDLNGKVAVVIGGTSGIGRAIAHGLAQAGADVIPTSRRLNRWKQPREIEALGRRTLRLTSDVLDRSSLQGPEKTLRFREGRYSCQFAGRKSARPRSISQMKTGRHHGYESDWQLRACQIFGRHMIERSWTHLKLLVPFQVRCLYEVVLFGQQGRVASLTKSLAVEWASHGVCVNAIAPGVFRTALNQKLLDESERGREFLLRTPMKRFGKVEELAGAAVFLASDAASFVTGEILTVDGGFLASGVNQ